jgi:hypothetical protein
MDNAAESHHGVQRPVYRNRDFCESALPPRPRNPRADVAIVGAPYDMGTQVRSGARYGERGIRNASAIYGMRSVKYYDSEFDEVYVDGVTIVDVGDAEMIHGRPDACLANIQATTEKILARGAMPVTLGGDHAVPIPILRAFKDRGPICGVQIGGLGSSDPQGFYDAKQWGARSSARESSGGSGLTRCSSASRAPRTTTGRWIATDSAPHSCPGRGRRHSEASTTPRPSSPYKHAVGGHGRSQATPMRLPHF